MMLTGAQTPNIRINGQSKTHLKVVLEKLTSEFDLSCLPKNEISPLRYLLESLVIEFFFFAEFFKTFDKNIKYVTYLYEYILYIMNK